MCVIINKKAGQKMINETTLRKAFNHNSDGAGIAWTLGTPNNPKPITLKKGFMTFDALWDYITKMKRRYGEDLLDLSMIIHCRITTHGGTSQYNTHPFPISSDMDDLNELSLKGLKTAVAHNGIVSSVNIPKTATYSDTMLFIQKQLYPISELNPNWYRFPKVLEALKDIIGSKLSILNDKGEIYTVGEFYQLDGLEFSNLYFNTSYYGGNYSTYREHGVYYGYNWDDNYENRWNDLFSEDEDDVVINVGGTKNQMEVIDEILRSDYTCLSGEEIIASLYDSKTKAWIPKAIYIVDLDTAKDYYCLEGIGGIIKYKNKSYVEYEIITVEEFLNEFKHKFFEVEIEMNVENSDIPEQKECLC